MENNELLDRLRAYFFGNLIKHSTLMEETILKSKQDNAPQHLTILYAQFLFDKVAVLAKQNGLFENKEQFDALFDIVGCTKFNKDYWFEKFKQYDKNGDFQLWKKEMEV